MSNNLTMAGLVAALLLSLAAAESAEPGAAAPINPLGAFLDQAGTNRAEIERALRESQGERREGMVFLVTNMPPKDLRGLTAGFLLENLTLAYEAWESAPWHDRLPRDIFLNDVLPYASLTEEREAWRPKMREKCAALVAGCKTPGDAARRLNERIYGLFKVHYQTGRRRPDQAPGETISCGTTTCTGLSILLVDACRSVGVPARIAGTPMWSDMRGNHTWVEVWDDGWHFVGAAEPDPKGMDRGWFVPDASEANAGVPENSIYASSFRRTGLTFPLVWMPAVDWVSAENVTDRYTAKARQAAAGRTKLMVRVLESPGGPRIEADLVVTNLAGGQPGLTGRSRGNTADLNDYAAFDLPAGSDCRVTARAGTQSATREFKLSSNPREVVTLTLSGAPSAGVILPPTYHPPAITKPLAKRDAESVKSAFTNYFAASPAERENWKFAPRLEKLLKANEPAVRLAAWEVYRELPAHAADKADYEAHRVNFQQYQSAYTVKTVGARPTNGWALFIAMHGGGNAPKELNDSQWRHMQIYYKDHPEAGGYIYVALRAPNDTWNGFYDDYVYPLIDNLIREFRLFGDIDPNKVFIMGYSHGGYGAFAIGPKIPDHFAAIHASAAAPTDGETTAKTLRTTVFTAMVGEKDTAYGRYERDLRFQSEIATLRGRRSDIYPVSVTVIPGNGHTGLPDRDKIVEMYPAVRNPVPREISWLMTDPVVTDFFWLQVPKAGKGHEILASCRENRFVVTANGKVDAATIWFDTRLIDFNEPIDIELNGSTKTVRFSPSLKTLGESLLRRGDPEFAFTAKFNVKTDESLGRLVLVQ